uniref:PKD domain-containing protein n=1 Tax=uncultured Methanofollis sp. TaxID=262500 RepID=UPI0026127A4B
DLEWSTGGDAPWFVDVDCVHTGTTSGRSGAIGSNQQSWLQTNITGPGHLTFAWNVSSEPRHDYLRLFIDGEEEKNLFGFPETWSEEEYRLGFGTHTVRWVYEKDSNPGGMMEDCGWLDNVTFTPIDDTDFVGNVTQGQVPLTVDFTGYSTGTATHWAWDFGDEKSAVGRNQTHTYTKPGVYNVTLIVKKDTAPDGQMEVKNGYITVTPTFEEALDAEGLAWTTGGDVPWFVDVNETYIRGSCGHSGAIKRNQQSWIETTVTGPKDLTFDWQVSSNKGHSMKYSDVLAFSIDGEMQKEIAGKGNGWQNMHYTLGRGEHTLRWTYETRAFSTYGDDCGWLDNVTLTDTTPVILFAPTEATVAAGTEREVAIVADHLPDGLKNVSLTVSLEGTNALITGVDSAFLAGASGGSGVPGTTITFDATDDGNSVEAGAEDVVLATLKVKGLTDGMVGITASDVVIYTDKGEETPVICRPGVIDVVGLSPLPGCTAIPGDGDGDGLFEDVNGDGTLDFRDALTYFEHFENVLSQKNPRVFDYNGNGRIDFDDVVTIHQHAGTDRT